MTVTEMLQTGAAAKKRTTRGASSGLKVTLKPFERIEIGPLTLINGWTESSTFSIEGLAPVLRQANFMPEDRADTSLRQVYLCLQRLYLRRDGTSIEQYSVKAEQLLQEMPAAAETIRKAGEAIAEGRLYAALKAYRDLLDTTEPDKAWSATATESAPLKQGHSQKPLSVEFVRDRRRYRAASASASAG